MNDRRRDGRKVIAVSERESMPYDVVIVGAGPAGLSAAIRLKQLANAAGSELSVCILEKGSEVGAHILSGAVIDPRSLDELLPEWRTMGCPLADVPVNDNQHWVLTRKKKFNLPEFISPPFMHNKAHIRAAWAIFAAGSPSRPRAWASKSSPAFRPPKSSITRMGR